MQVAVSEFHWLGKLAMPHKTTLRVIPEGCGWTCKNQIEIQARMKVLHEVRFIRSSCIIIVM
jgi:hypothetical protein